jgi:tetratricopeptide (TPR) repeat protein
MPLAVAALAFIAFIPALSASFVTWDDDPNFLDNPYYRGLGWRNLKWMWTTFHMGHYIPIAWMTLGLDYLIWGMNAFGYHLVNLLLHASNAVLLYWIARRLFAAQASEGPGGETSSRELALAAAVAALVFAIHPLRVESVAWITERRDVLSGVFYLATILLYLRWIDARDTGAARGESVRPVSAGAIALFVLALLSKATAMIVPAVLLILNVYPLRRFGPLSPGASSTSARISTLWNSAARRVYLEIAPFALLSAAIASLSIVALHPGKQLTFAAKLAVSAYSLAFYLWKTLIPSGLAPLYEMPKVIDPLATRYVVGYVVVISVSILAWAVRRRWPAVTTAWVAFLVISLPLLGVVQNGPQIVADRYTYQSSQALGVLAGTAILLLRRPRLSAGIASAYVLTYGALTWHQTGIWHDSERLWSRVLSVDSTSSIAQTAIANVYFKQGRTDEAVERYARALELDPQSTEVMNNLGVALAKQGKPNEAISYYERAVRVRPAYYEALNNWGTSLATLGDFAGAIERYTRALAIKPDYADAEVNWGNALVRLNKPVEAVPHYEAAVAIRPDHVEAQTNWGVALARLGRYEEAIEHFRAALALDPENLEARQYLAMATRLRQQP